eukprot:m.224008 g.224008  ORF g.224008 m.224008 type:complete len:69 (-) comp17028_c3_seq1:844-1050(-)
MTQLKSAQEDTKRLQTRVEQLETKLTQTSVSSSEQLMSLQQSQGKDFFFKSNAGLYNFGWLRALMLKA